MLRRCFPAALLLAAACAGEMPTESSHAPLARGPKPGSGGPAAIALFSNRSLGCDYSEAAASSGGAVSYATGICVRGGRVVPFLWSPGGAAVLADVTEGDGRAVADDGGVFGSRFPGPSPYVKAPGQLAVDLPLPPGASWGDVWDALPSGNVAVGSASWSMTDLRYLLWESSGGSWLVSELPGYFAALDAAGNTGVGRANNVAVAWRRSGPDWVSEQLPGGGANNWRGKAIDRTGGAIGGSIVVPLDRDPTIEYEQPVVWLADGNGGWSLERLTGLNITDGTAEAIETLEDGRIVAAGRLWEDLPGGTAQLWAIAWIRPAAGGAFGAPVKLAPLSRGAHASATSVNRKGEAFGWSNGKGGGRSAVMWRVP